MTLAGGRVNRGARLETGSVHPGAGPSRSSEIP